MFPHVYTLLHIVPQFMNDVVQGGILCKDFHQEKDGEQELKLFYFDVQRLLEDLFADPMAKGTSSSMCKHM